jgi:hypothetical protein
MRLPALAFVEDIEHVLQKVPRGHQSKAVGVGKFDDLVDETLDLGRRRRVSSRKIAFQLLRDRLHTATKNR